MTESIASLGRRGLEIFWFILGCLALLVDFLYWLLIAPFKGFRLRVHEAARQSVRMGVNAIVVIPASRWLPPVMNWIWSVLRPSIKATKMR